MNYKSLDIETLYDRIRTKNMTYDEFKEFLDDLYESTLEKGHDIGFKEGYDEGYDDAAE